MSDGPSRVTRGPSECDCDLPSALRTAGGAYRLPLVELIGATGDGEGTTERLVAALLPAGGA